MFYKAFNIENVNVDDIEEEELIKDVKSESPVLNNSSNDEIDTGIKSPSSFHNLCVKSINNVLNVSLHKVNRRLYASEDDEIGVIVSVSKSYKQGNRNKYWF